MHEKQNQGEPKMIEVGRVVVKIAGRDAGLKGLVVDILDNKYVLIDGQVRRRKCNIAHIEPLKEIIKIKKNASHEEVVGALRELNIEVKEKKQKEKKEKPRKKRKVKKKIETEEKKEIKKGLKERLVKKEVKEKAKK